MAQNVAIRGVNLAFTTIPPQSNVAAPMSPENEIIHGQRRLADADKGYGRAAAERDDGVGAVLRSGGHDLGETVERGAQPDEPDDVARSRPALKVYHPVDALARAEVEPVVPAPPVKVSFPAPPVSVSFPS